MPNDRTASAAAAGRALGVRKHVLADRQPELVLRRLQREAVAPHVVAQDMLLGQLERDALLGVERDQRRRGRRRGSHAVRGGCARMLA